VGCLHVSYILLFLYPSNDGFFRVDVHTHIEHLIPVRDVMKTVTTAPLITELTIATAEKLLQKMARQHRLHGALPVTKKIKPYIPPSERPLPSRNAKKNAIVISDSDIGKICIFCIPLTNCFTARCFRCRISRSFDKVPPRAKACRSYQPRRRCDHHGERETRSPQPLRVSDIRQGGRCRGEVRQR
jgi:hypothetical protein